MSPTEEGPFDFIWKINDNPDGSNLTLNELQFSDNESQAIFIPDVLGEYSIQVTVWKYNDKLGAIAFNYDIVEETSETIAQQDKNNEWLNESAEKEQKAAEVIVSEKVDNIKTKDFTSKPKAEVKESIKVETPAKVITPVETRYNTPSANGTNYTVQVAVQSTLESANNLVYSLNTAGYDAYIQELTTESNQKMYRVRVGKYSTREYATKVGEMIQREQGI